MIKQHKYVHVRLMFRRKLVKEGAYVSIKPSMDSVFSSPNNVMRERLLCAEEIKFVAQDLVQVIGGYLVEIYIRFKKVVFLSRVLYMKFSLRRNPRPSREGMAYHETWFSISEGPTYFRHPNIIKKQPVVNFRQEIHYI
jgi:hypothetical protein